MTTRTWLKRVLLGLAIGVIAYPFSYTVLRASGGLTRYQLWDTESPTGTTFICVGGLLTSRRNSLRRKLDPALSTVYAPLTHLELALRGYDSAPPEQLANLKRGE